MSSKMEQALDIALRNWQAMSGAQQDEAEATADEFEASFYHFIDAVRVWIGQLEPQPRTVDELFSLSAIETLIERLPGPLYLNFETECELILENIIRIDEDKYD